MQFGTLTLDGIGYQREHTVWPLIVLIEGFPLMQPVYGAVEQRIRRAGWPSKTLVDADELGAMEALVERGWTTIESQDRAWRGFRLVKPDLPRSIGVLVTPAARLEREIARLNELKTCLGPTSGASQPVDVRA